MLAVVNASVKNPGKDGNGPVLVHCSAGVGRTGTFIAIDHGIKCLQRDGKFRILETIRKLRQHRARDCFQSNYGRSRQSWACGRRRARTDLIPCRATGAVCRRGPPLAEVDRIHKTAKKLTTTLM